MPDRITRINEKLKLEVSKIVERTIDVDDAIVTVLGASASPTLEHASIWISVYPSSKIQEVMESISGSIYDIQKEVNKRFKIRTVPKVQFKIDRSEENAARVEEILSKDK